MRSAELAGIAFTPSNPAHCAFSKQALARLAVGILVRHGNDVTVAGIHLMKSRVAALIMQELVLSPLESSGSLMDVVFAAALDVPTDVFAISMPREQLAATSRNGSGTCVSFALD